VQQHPGLQQNQQLDVDNMEVDEADDEWPAWNPAVFAADNGQVLHQHPQFPQDHLDLELSGSSMRFLHGDGTDISLDRVLEGISVEDGSSSSSDASSTLVEDRARFAAAQKRCTNILIFNRKDMPDEVFHRASMRSGWLEIHARRERHVQYCLSSLRVKLDQYQLISCRAGVSIVE